MTKDEALNKIIEYCKNGSKTPVSDFCRIPCSICPFDSDYCENDIVDSSIERLVKAEEQSKSLEKTCYKLQQALEEKAETNFDHYYDGKLAFDDFANTGDEKLIADIYTLCFKTGTDEAYKKSGIYDFKRWLLEPYKPPKPKYKLSQFECDLIQIYGDTLAKVADYPSPKITDYYLFKEMRKKGYFKDIPSDALIKDILADCEVVEDD